MDQHHDCDILLAGDFNSRTGHLEDYILSDNTDYIPEIDGNDNYDTDHFEVPRNSKDPEQNSFGWELITFCRSYGIYILNRRKEGDIDGKITCISNRGSSVVNYMMVNTRVCDMVKRFEVLTHTESDHFPLICELDCKFMSHSSRESVLSEINFTSYKWCTSKENDFQEKLNDEYTSEKLDNIRGLLNQTPDINNVDKIVTLLQDSFRYWCGCMTAKPRQNHLNRQPPWYDDECRTIKKQKFTFLDMFAKTGTQFFYYQFRNLRNKFKHLVRAKAKSYMDSIDDQKKFWNQVKNLTLTGLSGSAVSAKTWFDYYKKLLN